MRRSLKHTPRIEVRFAAKRSSYDQKFISIKNVGRFENYTVRGNVEFQPFTLIFAENGRGKTTVGDIPRSVQSGDGSYILGRRRRSINFALVQHFIHHLAPQGVAGFFLANGSMSSNQSDEGDIRHALIEADLVDCMVALPVQLFYSTQIPACFWSIRKNGDAGGSPFGPN